MGHYTPFRIAAALMVVMLVGSILFSGRFIVLSDRPTVVYLSAIKMAPEAGDLVGELDDYGVHMRHERSKFVEMLRSANTMLGHPPRPDSFDNMTAPMMGYSVREWSFMGMPFGWKTDMGPVLYVNNDWGVIYGQLRPKALEEINKANGRDVTQVTIYPFWIHTWGWLFVLGAIGTWWLWNRGNQRRREELGLID